MFVGTWGPFKAAALALALAATVGCSSDGEGGSAGAGAAYPPGPYGLEQGDVIANMTLRTPAGEPITLAGLAGGSTRALLLYLTASWCFTAGPEITWLNTYPPRLDGALHATSVLLQNRQFEDADGADAEAFSEEYSSVFPTSIDPDGELDVFRDQTFIPLNLLVDTRTMRITLRQPGFDRPQLEQAIIAILESE